VSYSIECITTPRNGITFALFTAMTIRELYSVFLALIALFGAHTACHAQGKQYTDGSISSSAQVETFEDRVDAFWKARVAGDLLMLYELEAVSVTDQITLRQYMNKSGQLIYKNAKITETNLVSDDEAYAEIKAEVIVPGLKGTLNSRFKDQWININGQWYHRGRARLPVAKIE
jgi:hypothetical protein